MRYLCCSRRRCCLDWWRVSGNTSSNIPLNSTSFPNTPCSELEQFQDISFRTAVSFDDTLGAGPSFNNLGEFLSCDPDSKHRVPISISEFTFLDELMDGPSSTWSVVVGRPGIEIQQKLDKSSPSVLIRCFFEYDDVLPAAFLYNLVEADQRMTWDNMFTDLRVLEECGECKDFIYFVLPSPAPMVAARDFVLHRRIVIEDTPEGKRYRVLQRSAVHASMPAKRGIVRAENIIGGYSVIRKSGSSKTSLFVTTMSDPKGYVPAWAVNAMASTKLLSWVNCLHRASKEITDADMLEAWAQKYSNA